MPPARAGGIVNLMDRRQCEVWQFRSILDVPKSVFLDREPSGAARNLDAWLVLKPSIFARSAGSHLLSGMDSAPAAGHGTHWLRSAQRGSVWIIVEEACPPRACPREGAQAHRW